MFNKTANYSSSSPIHNQHYSWVNSLLDTVCLDALSLYNAEQSRSQKKEFVFNAVQAFHLTPEMLGYPCEDIEETAISRITEIANTILKNENTDLQISSSDVVDRFATILSTHLIDHFPESLLADMEKCYGAYISEYGFDAKKISYEMAKNISVSRIMQQLQQFHTSDWKFYNPGIIQHIFNKKLKESDRIKSKFLANPRHYRLGKISNNPFLSIKMDGIRPQDKGWIRRANIKTPKQFSKKTAKFLTDQWRSNPSARAIYYSQQTIQNFLDSQNHIQKHKSP